VNNTFGYVKKSIIFLLIYVLNVASNNISLPGYGRPSGIFYAFILLIGVYIFFKKIVNGSPFVLPLFFRINFLILLFFSLIGGIIIQDYRVIYIYYSFVLLFLIVWSVSLDALIFDNSKMVALLTTNYIIVANLIMLVIGFMFNGISIFRYEGIFDMPNSMGRFSGYSLVLTVTYILFLHKSNRYSILPLLVTLMLFATLILSNSRTAMLSSFIAIVILVSVYAKIKRIKGKAFLFFLFFIAFTLFLLNIYFYEILEIFMFKFNRGDGSSGRFDLWESGIQYFNFFGSSEYNNLSSRIDVHNNYLSQILKYGVVPGIAFHLIPLFFFIKSYKRIIQIKNNVFSLAVVLGMSSFLLVYYLFETSSIIAPFLLMLIYTGLSYKDIFFKRSL